MVYSVSGLDGNAPKNYGLASALSIVIFIIVATISALGFRQTRTLEEITDMATTAACRRPQRRTHDRPPVVDGVGWRHVVGVLAIVYAGFPLAVLISAVAQPAVGR